ncbi:MAG TPA: glutaredoxin domain-containing protein [Dokdonella sp.]
MKEGQLKHLALTLAVIVSGAAIGWIGVRAMGAMNASPSVEAGDYSKIVDAAQHSAVLFSTSTCPYCRRARDLLDATKADYRVYEIDTSEEAHRLYQALGFSRVPVLITRDTRIVGFSENLYRLRTNPAPARE